MEDANESLGSATEEAVAKNRLVAATVNGMGELIDLKFHTQAYRDMAPAELSEVILDTVKRARARMGERVSEIYKPLAPDGVDMQAVMEGRFDPAEMFRRLGSDLHHPPFS
ncbi:YbaB/EbfC family nucleoid-associated protein [Streptomonospora wellingtoniae]|uniref:YbaB/EbfC family nucleoid-associated protein n=1 Tax=Streptomonospora wellingtoniae TaxID=3075544 RepID=A0ABU2L042_9ACTN|nr:YbaB/EbfC family nucleoid-associated protein [Streptomonospora sp. DSM 45055]MDT0304708.1 YbaB/EbfC family nucleoid-associated protein [Streptomonospora sp. DSM 45055]